MRGKSYTIYHIVTALIQEAAIFLTWLWLLPQFGVKLPVWGISLVMIVWGVYSHRAYRITKKLQDKRVLDPAEAMIGRKGKVVTPLSQRGIVRVNGELWKASATDPLIKCGEEVVVVGIKGLCLTVSRVEIQE